jgi:hypothetical protein
MIVPKDIINFLNFEKISKKDEATAFIAVRTFFCIKKMKEKSAKRDQQCKFMIFL